MPIFISTTKRQIRQNVGLALGAIDMGAGAIEYTASASNSTTTKITVATAGFGTNEHRGRWVYITDTSSNANQIRRVTDSSTAGVLTLASALSSATSTNTTFELWDQDVPPQIVNNMIDRAITSLSRKQSAAAEDTSLHTGGGIRAFNLPSSTAISGVAAVEYRRSVVSQSLNDGNSAWTTSTSNITVDKDTENWRQQSASVRTLAAAGFTGGAMAYGSASGDGDLRGFTHLEAFVQSSSSHAAGVFQLGIDNSTDFSSPIANLDVGALDANTWTHQQLALSSTQAANSTGIVTVGLSSTSDPGTGVYTWVNGVQMVRKGTEEWVRFARTNWTLDKANDQIVFTDGAIVPSYNMLRLVGWLIPSVPASDTAAVPVSPDFLNYKVQALVMRSLPDRGNDQRASMLLDAERIDALAEDARRKASHTIGGVRWRS